MKTHSLFGIQPDPPIGWGRNIGVGLTASKGPVVVIKLTTSNHSLDQGAVTYTQSFDSSKTLRDMAIELLHAADDLDTLHEQRERALAAERGKLGL